jgi:hypothetical protein
VRAEPLAVQTGACGQIRLETEKRTWRLQQDVAGAGG